MKFSPLLVLALASSACERGAPSAATPAATETAVGGLAVLAPEHEAHANWVDMGDIPFGEVREKIVKLANREGRPLVVTSLQAGCSCTLASLSYTDANGRVVTGDARARDAVITVPADALVDLKLRVDSHAAPAKNVDKLVIVRIVSDSATNPYFTLDVRMKIDSPFQAVPPELDLGRIPTSGGGVGEAMVRPIPQTDNALLGVLRAPQGVEAELVPPAPGGGPASTLRVRVLPPLPLGSYTATITLRTTGPGGEGEGRPFDVPVRAYVVGDVEVLPARLLVARAEPGAAERGEGDLYVRLAGGKLRVTKHELVGAAADKLTVELTPLAPDDDGRSGQWHFALAATGDLGAETLSGTLVLETDDPQHARIEVPWLRRAAVAQH